MVEEIIKIFVYGSLKKSCWANKAYLNEAVFICETLTQDNDWKMLEYTSGLEEEKSFPAIQRNGNGYILGELYKADKKILAALDAYENNGSNYVREIIKLKNGEQAYAYIGLDQPIPECLPAQNVLFNDIEKAYIWSPAKGF